MMKKIFSKYFVVAVVAVAMGCISSCKDFEDEMYSELRGQDVALKKDLNEQIGKLRQEMKDSLQKARDEREALQDALDAHIADAKAKYATKDELAAEKTALEQQIAAGDATLQTKLNATNARIDSLNRELAVTVSGVETLINDLAGVTGRIETLEQDYAKVEYVDEEIAKINSQLANCYTKEQADSAIKAAASDDTFIQQLVENKSFIQQVTENKVFGGDTIINITNLTQITDVSDSVLKVAAKNATAIEELKNQLCKIDCAALLEDLTDLQTKVDSIEEVCATLESDVEEAKALAEEAKEFAKEYTDLAIDKILAYTEPRFNSIEEMLAELFTQTEEQEDWLKEHEAEINELLANVEDLKKRVEANEKAIESLTERMDVVEDVLENRISSVVLQATKSPVVGYFNIPMGIKSNVLAAYYGEAMSDVYFPTVRTANLISGKAFTDKEAALLGFSEALLAGEGETLIDDAEGNAGTLYVTINPAEVDLTGVEFSLVNSIDEVSYVALSDFEESTEKLTFGYTRGANGFYEAKATISAEDAAAAKMRVDFNEVKELASELKSSVENLNVDFTGIAASIQSIVNDVADASALKASWEDKMGSHNVYSEYALAAMTVKPLSFQFMQNFEMKNFPGITRVSNFINNAIDKINITLPKFDMDFTAPEIQKIQIKDFDELGVNCIIETTVKYNLNMSIPVADVTVPGQDINVPGTTITVPEQTVTTKVNSEDVTIVIPAQTVTIDGQKVKVDGTTVKIANVEVNKVLEIPVKYDMTDIIKDLYGNVTEPIEDVNKMLGDLEDFMDDVNKMLEELDAINNIEQSITDAKNDIKKELNGYLERLNNKLCGAINSVHDRLQPNMLLKTEDGFAMLSQVEKKPTELDAANCVLVPTTYTGELLVPAFKKYVAVVNVKDAEGNDVTSAEIANVNTGKLNTVLAGSTTEIEFAGKSGYTYEIVYSALDYSGKYSNVRYYVTVK